MSLAEHVKTVRTQHLALTQRELSIELGVDAMTVSRWERGKADPSLAHIRRLSELSELPVSWFFSENGAVA